MTIGDKLFHVVTHFEFSAQEAIADSQTLKGNIAALSQVAGEAQSQVAGLGVALASMFGVGYGVFGFLSKVVESSDYLKKNTLAFANILGANMQHLSGDVQTFNDRLVFSEQLIDRIAKTAREFSLDEGAMLETTKAMAARMVPEGLAGHNLENAVNLARMFEKSAPILGVDTFESQNQLGRMMEGHASGNDTLFSRLIAETDAFKQFKGKGGTQKFNAMAPDVRLDTIMRGMAQFSSQAEVNAGMAELVSMRFQVLKNQLFGLRGIMLPVGNVITNHLRPAFNKLSDIIETRGRPLMMSFANALDYALDNLAGVWAFLQQARMLGRDVARAGRTVATTGFVQMLTFLGLFGKTAGKIGGAASALLTPLVLFANILGAIGDNMPKELDIFSRALGVAQMFVGGFMLIAFAVAKFGGAKTAMRVIGTSFMIFGRVLLFAVGRILAPFMLLTALFSIITRAAAKARAQDVMSIPALLERLAPRLIRLKNAAADVVMFFAGIGEKLTDALVPLFRITGFEGPMEFVLDFLSGTMENFMKFVRFLYAWTQGVLTGLFQFYTVWFDTAKTVVVNIFNVIVGAAKDAFSYVSTIINELKSGNFMAAKDAATKNPFDPSKWDLGIKGEGFDIKSIWDAAKFGFQSTIAENQANLRDPNARERNVSNHNTYVGKVEIRQDFKENQEPDRIAHSLVKTLTRVTLNPQQAAGRSVSAAMMR